SHHPLEEAAGEDRGVPERSDRVHLAFEEVLAEDRVARKDRDERGCGAVDLVARARIRVGAAAAAEVEGCAVIEAHDSESLGHAAARTGERPERTRVFRPRAGLRLEQLRHSEREPEMAKSPARLGLRGV